MYSGELILGLSKTKTKRKGKIKDLNVFAFRCKYPDVLLHPVLLFLRFWFSEF